MVGRAPLLWCLASAVLFGASTPLSKHLLADIGPITLAGLLYLGAAAAVLPASLRGGSRERRRQPRHKLYLGAAILFGGVLGPVLLLWGLSAARSGSVSLWLNLEAVATAALAYAFFREHLGWRTHLAVGVTVIAGVLLAAPGAGASIPAALLVAGACLCWGLDNNATALIDGYTPAQSTLIKGVVAGALNLGVGLALEPSALAPGPVLAALAVGGLCYGVSIVLYIAGAQQLGATRAQLLFASGPYVGLVLSWALLGEPATAEQGIAAALMAAGIALLLTGTHDHEHHHAAVVHSHSHRHDDGHHTHVHPGLPAWLRHTHEHHHEPMVHAHPHVPDLHHRHDH